MRKNLKNDRHSIGQCLRLQACRHTLIQRIKMKSHEAYLGTPRKPIWKNKLMRKIVSNKFDR